MNLHGIVRGAITTVNPDIPVIYQKSTGYTTDTAGKRTPSYAPATPGITAQVQALTGKELEQVQNLNIQGVLRKAYMYGNTQGAVRADQKGGDLLTFPQVPGGTDQAWLVVQVFETWPDWCAVAVWLQQ